MADTDAMLVVCGSRRTPSRTRSLSQTAADRAADAGLEVEVLDLGDTAMALFDDRALEAYDDATIESVERLLEYDRYLIASPIYFAGISGALKNLIDHVPYEDFREADRAAGLLATGRDKRHQLAIDTQLRAILVYLGVDVATTSVFATEADFEDFTLTNADIEVRIDRVVEETVALGS